MASKVAEMSDTGITRGFITTARCFAACTACAGALMVDLLPANAYTFKIDSRAGDAKVTEGPRRTRRRTRWRSSLPL